MKNAMIRARVSEELKAQAEAIMEAVGINPTQAITMFYKQLVLHRGLPFDVRVPNHVTLAAMESDDLTTYSSPEAMFDDLDGWSIYQQKITSQFKKDYKKAKKQNKDLELLKKVMSDLIAGKALEERFKDHVLLGNWKPHRECHIQPAWLLIYRIEADTIIFVRAGSHAELF